MITTQKGITIQTSEGTYLFKGTITIVPGDNLASQYIGGYKSLASAHRKCRNCFAISDDMQSQVIVVALKCNISTCIAVSCTSI